MRPLRRGKPDEYQRCSGCHRLVEKERLWQGPDGARYGPECYARALRAYLSTG